MACENILCIASHEVIGAVEETNRKRKSKMIQARLEIVLLNYLNIKMEWDPLSPKMRLKILKLCNFLLASRETQFIQRSKKALLFKTSKKRITYLRLNTCLTNNH